MGAGDPTVRVRIRRTHAKLVEALAEREGGKARDEWNLPARGEPGGDPHHVGFLDADVEEALREVLAERPAESGLGEVGIDGDDVAVLSAELEEGVTVRLASCSTHLESVSHCGKRCHDEGSGVRSQGVSGSRS